MCRIQKVKKYSGVFFGAFQSLVIKKTTNFSSTMSVRVGFGVVGWWVDGEGGRGPLRPPSSYELFCRS